MSDDTKTGSRTETDQALAYSPARAAEIAGRSVGRIFRLIAAGKLTARKDGNSTLIERDELARWIKSLPVKKSQVG